jgi:hypothetical protein
MHRIAEQRPGRRARRRAAVRPEPVFVTGMFRSGTTLVSTMLQAHPQACCAADCFLPVFKSFRDAVAARHGLPGGDPDAPLDDYYFRADAQRLMAAIAETPLTLAVDPAEVAALRGRVAAYSAEYAPRVAARAGELDGGTYRDLLEGAFAIVRRAYGDDGATTVAFKAVWTCEFAPHVLAAFPDAKVVHIVRDPRAVCASKNVLAEKYPWLFLIRQWRKLATFAWRNARDPALASRVAVLRYEDLVDDPGAQAGCLASFLGLDDAAPLVDSGAFLGGDGRPWQANSSHATGVGGISRDFRDRWRDVLSPDERALVEYLTAPEMAAFGYRPGPPLGDRLPLSLQLAPPRVPEDAQAGWLRRYPLYGDSSLADMALEGLRYDLAVRAPALDETDARAFFLSAEFYDGLRAGAKP